MKEYLNLSKNGIRTSLIYSALILGGLAFASHCKDNLESMLKENQQTPVFQEDRNNDGIPEVIQKYKDGSETVLYSHKNGEDVSYRFEK